MQQASRMTFVLLAYGCEESLHLPLTVNSKCSTVNRFAIPGKVQMNNALINKRGFYSSNNKVSDVVEKKSLANVKGYTHAPKRLVPQTVVLTHD